MQPIKKANSGWLQVMPQGARQGVIAAIVAKTVPAVVGLAVTIAGYLEGIPWAYVITAASVSGGFLFFAIPAGLNQMAALLTRPGEDDALNLQGPRFQVALHSELDNRLGVNAEFAFRNSAPFKIRCAITKATCYLMKADGTGKRDSLPEINTAEQKINAAGHAEFGLGAVIFDDLKNEKSLRGGISLSYSFGRKKLHVSVDEEFIVYGTRQLDGQWEFRAEKPFA